MEVWVRNKNEMSQSKMFAQQVKGMRHHSHTPYNQSCSQGYEKYFNCLVQYSMILSQTSHMNLHYEIKQSANIVN